MVRTAEINPPFNGFYVSWKFGELLDTHGLEGGVRYFGLDPDDEDMMDALREFEPEEPDEAEAIKQIIALIEQGKRSGSSTA